MQLLDNIMRSLHNWIVFSLILLATSSAKKEEEMETITLCYISFLVAYTRTQCCAYTLCIDTYLSRRKEDRNYISFNKQCYYSRFIFFSLFLKSKSSSAFQTNLLIYSKKTSALCNIKFLTRRKMQGIYFNLISTMKRNILYGKQTEPNRKSFFLVCASRCFLFFFFFFLFSWKKIKVTFRDITIIKWNGMRFYVIPVHVYSLIQ